MAGYFFRYVAPKIAKNLTKKRNILDDLIKSRDKHLAGVRDKAKVEIKSKNPLSKFTKKIEKIVDKKATGGRVGKMRGGFMGKRMGYKKGTGLMKKKSNVEKIKETFDTKKKKKKKFPDLTGDGKVTFADILKGRGVINGKKKKKVI